MAYEDVLDGILDASGRVFGKLTKAYDKVTTNKNLRLENIQSFLEHRPISSYLNYAYSIQYENNTELYVQKDGAYGIILEVFLSTFPTISVQKSLVNILKTFGDGVDVVTFNTFCSSNIHDDIEQYKNIHHCENVNIRNPDILKKMINERAEFLTRATRQSLYNNVDFKLRNYICTVSVLFNKNMNEEEALAKSEEIQGFIGNSIPCRTLNSSRYITLLREFFHQDKDHTVWNNTKDNYTDISTQACAGGLTIDVKNPMHPNGFVINDSIYCTTMTTKKFPLTINYPGTDALFVDRFGDRLASVIRGSYFTSLVLDYRDLAGIKKRAMRQSQTNLEETLKHNNKTLKKKPHIKHRKDESQLVIRALDGGQDRPISAQWSLVLYDDDLSDLRNSISNLQNTFSHAGWDIIPETFGHVALFSALNSLPLQLNESIDIFLKRKPILFEESNISSILPWIGDSRGYTHRKHIPTFSRTGQIQWFDPMDSSTGYNIACTGFTGSGKSFEVNDICMHCLASGYLVRIIDSLPSYKKITNAIGGQYEDFTTSDICLNFFTHLKPKVDEITGKILTYTANGNTYEHIADDDYSTIIPMIGAMCNINLSYNKSNTDNTIINGTNEAYLAGIFEEAIKASWEAKKNNAGMSDIYVNVSKIYKREKEAGNKSADLLHSVITALARFGSETGQFYKQFNGVNNLQLASDYAVFELTTLESRGILYHLTLMSIANQIANEFFDMDNATRPKILIIEEFWKYIDHPVILNFSIELARKIRKAGGIFMPVTQGIDDFFRNEQMKSIYDNCNWQLFFQNKGSSIDNALKTRKLSLSEYLSGLLRKIKPGKGLYGEFAILTNESIQISRNRTDGVAYYLYTTNTDDEKILKMTSDRLGITYVQSIMYNGILRDHPYKSHEEIMVEIGLMNEEEVAKNKEYVAKKNNMIKQSIENTVVLSNQRPIFYELSTLENPHIANIKAIEYTLKNSNNEYFKHNEYSKHMIEMERDVDLSKIFFDSMISSNLIGTAYKVGFIVTLNVLMSNIFHDFIKAKQRESRFYDFALIIDLSTMDLCNIEPIMIEAFLEEWEKLNIDIYGINYNINIDNSMMRLFDFNMIILNAEIINPEDILQTIEIAKIFTKELAIINIHEDSIFENVTYYEQKIIESL
ncbi:TraC family protein [Aquamicrobium sp.]|uniref:TraC family protein n=1 Tax=Aquamicrobium sp. TaxID=1872579 RepID=UPI002588F238|nr:TraC family protein [Aquamicrobium sp.]MCK9549279.1 TraC family protein [Aquamicrobium sp.]